MGSVDWIVSDTHGMECNFTATTMKCFLPWVMLLTQTVKANNLFPWYFWQSCWITGAMWEHGQKVFFETLLKMLSHFGLLKFHCNRISSSEQSYCICYCNKPQSFPPICFWHLFTVTSMSLSGPDASKLYTRAICLRNGGVSVVFAESYPVTLPPNEHDMTQWLGIWCICKASCVGGQGMSLLERRIVSSRPSTWGNCFFRSFWQALMCLSVSFWPCNNIFLSSSKESMMVSFGEICDCL